MGFSFGFYVITQDCILENVYGQRKDGGTPEFLKLVPQKRSVTRKKSQKKDM